MPEDDPLRRCKAAKYPIKPMGIVLASSLGKVD
jgi:hypothetical protein